jgi:hypothetical protein
MIVSRDFSWAGRVCGMEMKTEAFLSSVGRSFLRNRLGIRKRRREKTVKVDIKQIY